MEARCTKTGKTYYLRYDLGADDYWTLTYGVKSIPADCKGSTSSSSQMSISKIKTGPQFKCPHCGNTSFVKCGKCGKFTCYNPNSKRFECGYCDNKGEVSGYIKTDEYSKFDKKKGLGQ